MREIGCLGVDRRLDVELPNSRSATVHLNMARKSICTNAVNQKLITKRVTCYTQHDRLQ